MLACLRILEAEINLREETRVAEQAKTTMTDNAHAQEAARLVVTQRDIVANTRDVVNRMSQLPDSEKHFGKEISLLENVAIVMDEARVILASRETGDPAVAAETEAIELLLQSKRINPSGGGGSGTQPGGGGGGDTSDSAIALLGKSRATTEVRQETGQGLATGISGSQLPAEWREGIDEYFNRLENASAESLSP